MHLCLSQSFAVSRRYTHALNTTAHTVSHRLGLCVIGEKEKKPLTVGRVIGLSQTIFSGPLTRLTLCPMPFPKKKKKKTQDSAQEAGQPRLKLSLQCLLVFIRPDDIQSPCDKQVATLMKRPVDTPPPPPPPNTPSSPCLSPMLLLAL